MRTTLAIAEKFYQEWLSQGIKERIPELMARAIDEALDQLDNQELALLLRQAERDRDSWMDAYLRRGAELAALRERDK